MNVNGILLLRKHTGITSHSCVSAVRRILRTRQVGHAGTLDPLASGVLPILVGSATKLSAELSGHDKRYRAALLLGRTTDTLDVTGVTLSESTAIPSGERVYAAAAGFVGEIQQVPPMYSALKVGGKKLYELARSGVSVERAARAVTIYSLDVYPTDSVSTYILDIACSKGTYIRTLCADIGEALGCGGTMAALERTECGGFHLADTLSLDELEAAVPGPQSGPLPAFIPVSAYLERGEPASIHPPEFFAKLLSNGAAVAVRKLVREPAGDFIPGERVLMYNAGRLFASGRVGTHSGELCVKAEYLL
jgi:tRNA pseudouridine55 synthase